jgi:hypothetical protein
LAYIVDFVGETIFLGLTLRPKWCIVVARIKGKLCPALQPKGVLCAWTSSQIGFANAAALAMGRRILISVFAIPTVCRNLETMS